MPKVTFTTDVKAAYERGFKDACKGLGINRPDEYLQQCYEKWVKE